MKIEIIFFEDDDCELPERPRELIGFFENLLSQIPEAYRDSAQIEVSGESRWDCGYVGIKARYFRPMTKEERAEKKQYEEDKRVELLMRKKAQLEKLKIELGE